MSEQIVSIFFNILNVAVLIGVGWYVYQTRAKKQLADAKEKEQKEAESVQRSITESEHLFEKVAEATHEQKKYCDMLAKRVRQWQEHEASLIAMWQRERELLIKKIHARHERQQHGLIMLYAHHHLLPTAVTSATQAVTEQFAEHKKGEEYIRAIIGQLAKLEPQPRGPHGI